MKNLRLLVTLAILGCSVCLFGEGEPNKDYGVKPQKTEEAEKIHQENLKTYQANKDVLVLPGLIAKRKEKRVEILTETTGIKNDEAVEFLVVALTSSHGYESCMWSYAKPSDIHKALVFIGVPAGAPYNAEDLRFWAKGERVTVSLEKEGGESIRIEDLIYNKKTKEPLPRAGCIFTGSIFIPDPKDPTKEVYLADNLDPQSVLASFNSSLGVLEPVWEMGKVEAYESYQIHPDFDLSDHRLRTLVIEPELKDGKSRVRDLTMNVVDRKTFIISDKDGKQLTPDTSFKAALNACREIMDNGQDPYVTLVYNEDLMLAELQLISSALVMLDQSAALRIEPPLPGRLYYRSFMPPNRLRTAADRPSQSWEIHVSKTTDELSSTMIIYEEIRQADSTEPELKKHSHKAPTPASVRKILDDDAAERQNKIEPQLAKVLFVYAPADLKYGELLKFLAPAIKTHKIVHLYLEAPRSLTQPKDE